MNDKVRGLVEKWRHNAQGCCRKDSHAAGTWRSCAYDLEQALAAPVDDGDIYEAYKAWPEDIRQKLSLHDLRRINGWVRRPTGSWAIDTSAGKPILVYENCSVIEDEQARYVLGLIEKDCAHAEGAEVVAFTEDEIVDAWGAIIPLGNKVLRQLLYALKEHHANYKDRAATQEVGND